MKNCLAVVSSEKELSSIAEKLKGECTLTALCHGFSPVESHGKDVSIKHPEEIISEGEFAAIEEKAAFFARNWYSFDSKFSQEITFNGISLGFLHENDISFIFRTNFVLLQALEKEIAAKPEKILANKNGFIGVVLTTIAKAKGLQNLELLDLQAEKAYSRLPNISKKKIGEVKRNLSKAFSGFFSHHKGETVFVRGRGYIGNVEQELKKDSALNVISLDDFLLKELLNPINLLHYISTRTKMQKKFQKVLQDFQQSAAFKEKFVFNGINFAPLFAFYFPQFSERDWPEFVFLIEKLSELFEKKRPAAVVLWVDAVAFEKICVALAKRHNAKSIVLQHGIFRPSTKKGDWIRGFAPVHADMIAVWGDRFRQYLESHEVPAGKIFVTGAPRFDSIARTRPVSQPNRNGPVVFATQYDTAHIAKELVAAMKHFPEKQLVIKAHPMADAAPYKRILKELDSNAIIMKDKLQELLQSCSVLVTHSSTVGLEAMVLGKPVIVIEQKSPGHDPYGKTNAVLRASNAEELKLALEKVFSGNNKKLKAEMEKFVFEMLYKQDGKATERVVKLIKSLVS